MAAFATPLRSAAGAADAEKAMVAFATPAAINWPAATPVIVTVAVAAELRPCDDTALALTSIRLARDLMAPPTIPRDQEVGAREPEGRPNGRDCATSAT